MTLRWIRGDIRFMPSKDLPADIDKTTSSSAGEAGAGRQAIQVTRLYRIAQTVMHLQDISTLTSVLTGAMKDYLDARLGVIEGDDVVLHTLKGIFRFRTGKDGLIGWVAAHRTPLLVDDVTRDSRYIVLDPEGDKTRSELVVPIIFNDELLGVLDLHNDEIGAFTEEDLQFAEAVAGFLGVAIQNARFYEETKTHANRLSIVGKVAADLTALQPVKDLLNNTTQTIYERLDYAHVSIGLIEGEYLVYKTRYDRDEKLRGSKLRRLRIGEGVTGRVAATGQAIILPDVHQVPDYVGDFEEIRSEMGIPIRVGDRILGVINVESPKVNAFSESDQQIIQTLADQVAVALDNARLYDETQLHMGRLTLMADTAADLTALQPVKDLLNHTARTICERLGYLHVSIGLVEGEYLEYKAEYDRDGKSRKSGPSRLQIGQGITGRVAATGLAIIVPDTRQAPDYIGNFDEMRSEIGIPIRSGDRVLGVINVESPEINAFSESDQQIIQTLADQVAVTLENARLYHMLEETQTQLVESERLRAVGELAAGIAHNFNNVLTSILGYAELLAMEPELKPYKSHLQVITQSAQQGSSIARRLQDFTRIQVGASMQAVNLKEAIEQAVRITHPRWNNTSDTLARPVHMVAHLDTPSIITGNMPELIEVFTNIILNAIDAMPDGGTLTIATSVKDKEATVTISDTGYGMDDRTRSHIFEPFYTTKGPALGSGLGLSAAHGIVKRHGGSIFVTSEEGRGTVFTVEFPVKTEQEKDQDETSDEPVSPQRILIIDDEERVQKLMARMLASHQVDVASSGEVGIQLFHQYRHDVVFTDIGLPGLTGWNVAHVVRQTDPTVAIIAVTGWGKNFAHGQRQASDVDMVLTKPFTIQELRGILNRAIRVRDDRQSPDRRAKLA